MKTKRQQQANGRRAFSLLETVITIGIVIVVAEVVYSWSFLIMKSGRDVQARTAAAGIATEQIEIIRNAKYDDVGTTTGLPTGIFLATQTVTRGDLTYTVNISVDYVDDPFDGDASGTIPAKPVDTVPADYKRVEVSVCWNRECSQPVQLTSTVAPQSLETPSNTGALFIAVTDSDGLAVPLVDVVVTNPSVAPAVNIVNKTDIEGRLQLLALPPADNTYHIAVSKPGYTSDATGTPVNPDTTVVVGGVTPASLSIDRVSSLVIKTEHETTCAALGNIQFRLTGAKLISTEPPDVLKYDQTFTTDGNGDLVIPNLEWDDYSVTVLTPGFDLAGASAPLPVKLAANTTLNLNLRLADHQDHSLLVTVLDAGTKLPLADASVHVEGAGYDESKITNQGYLTQTDWSGGAGQAAIGDPARYESDAGSIQTTPVGMVTLASQDQAQTAAETFATADFRDAIFTTATWTTGSPGSVTLPADPLAPGNYLNSAVAQSTKLNLLEGRILDVTLTATESLNGQGITYFVAADGVQFEPVTPGVSHPFGVTGNDLRWQALLATTDPLVTPSLSGVTLTYTQRNFTGLSGTLTSSTFDAGSSSSFSSFSWNPGTQPVSTGVDSLKFQIATNNDSSTWNYLGPDGAAGTYYTVSGTTVAPIHAGDRYLRYRAYLATTDPTTTPSLADIAIVHSNSCFSPGQVFFTPLPASGDYEVTVEKTGYVSQELTVTINGWTRQIFKLGF